MSEHEVESTATEQPSAEIEARNRQLEMAARAILDGDVDDGLRSDPEAATRMILERILNAETFEDAFAPQQLVAWRETLMDVPVLVKEFRFNRSGYTVGSPIYAVVDLVRLDTGEAITVTCGGRNVLAQLLAMLKNGWTDRPVSMASRTTAENYSVLWLVPAGTPEHAAEKAAAYEAAQDEEAPF